MLRCLAASLMTGRFNQLSGGKGSAAATTAVTEGNRVNASFTLAGSARVLDDNSAAIKTAVELIDNAVSGAGFNITQIGGAAAPIGAGVEATAVRVTLPTDGTGVVKLGAGTAEIGKLAAGTAIIGQVGIDQTTPGTTNKVVASVASGGIASGAVASGAFASGSVASGAMASGSYAANAFALGVYATPTAVQTTAYAASLVGKAAAGTLYQVFGYNSHSATVFIQVHNTASLPADTAVPIITFAVPATSNFDLDLGLMGRAFATGITFASSSTGPTLTVSGATAWINGLVA